MRTASLWMTTLQGLFGGASAPEPEAVLTEIRQAMLQSLGESGATDTLVIQRKIKYALGFEELWYLRGDVMAIIAAVYGESVAKSKITDISNMFKGHLPKGLASRPSPLSE